MFRSACLLSEGHTTVLSPASTGSGAPIEGPVAVDAEVFLPSRTDMLRSSGVRLPALDGESRGGESIDGRPGVVFWFLDGGRSLGNRENVPCWGGPVDIVDVLCLPRADLLTLSLSCPFYFLFSKRAPRLGREAGCEKMEAKAQSTTDACWLLCQGLDRDWEAKSPRNQHSGVVEKSTIIYWPPADAEKQTISGSTESTEYTEPTAQVQLAKSEQAS